MNASILRGSAVLALLCFIPRVSALTISQTYSGTTSGFFSPGELDFYSSVTAPSVSDVKSITITGDFVTVINSFFINPGIYTGGPFTHTVWLDSHFTIAGLPLLSSASIPHFNDTATKAPIPLVPDRDSFVATFSRSFAFTLTDPNDIAGVMGSNRLITLGQWAEGTNFYGAMTGNSTVNLTVTVAYGLPDGGDTIGLFAAALFGFGVIHLRRMTRPLPV